MAAHTHPGDTPIWASYVQRTEAHGLRVESSTARGGQKPRQGQRWAVWLRLFSPTPRLTLHFL